MSNGSDIAAEVAAALGEATASIGDGELKVNILRQGTQTGPAYDPTYGPDTSTPVNALIGTYTAFERATGLISETDIKLTVAAGQGIEPTNADRVEIDGKPHEIKRVDPLKLGGVALMYKLQVKA